MGWPTYELPYLATAKLFLAGRPHVPHLKNELIERGIDETESVCVSQLPRDGTFIQYQNRLTECQNNPSPRKVHS